MEISNPKVEAQELTMEAWIEDSGGLDTTTEDAGDLD
jgi:hypothetical protein